LNIKKIKKCATLYRISRDRNQDDHQTITVYYIHSDTHESHIMQRAARLCNFESVCTRHTRAQVAARTAHRETHTRVRTCIMERTC